MASYQLKDVVDKWFTLWKEKRGADAASVSWDCFAGAFLDRFFPRELRISKAGDDLQNFSDEVKKILEVLQVTRNDKVEMAPYQLKDVAHIWFTLWKDNRGADTTSVSWDCFTRAFLDRFFPREVHHLSKYAPHMVTDPRAQIFKFLFGVSNLVKTEWKNYILLWDMDISRIMTHAQQVDRGKLREMANDKKKGQKRKS
ncbi:hypothetical protein MTR67_023188 [Solanum verrucosum]|uniref:Retrotransposon gag domain-containing protein n=1 Tax=Solanum verrucosum TaxID=315347 RepID=A0AAF0QUW9_SOLVR|nr:hypothetical protein MTR67_023188 [Solanum verrucosum]